MKIIALSGSGNTGKTTTINLVFEYLNSRKETYKLLKDKHFYNPKDEIIVPSKNGSKDFIAIFEDISTSKKIGISSYGDDYKTVNLALGKLEKCDVVVTACRTYGGTIDAINEFNQTPKKIKKTVNYHLNSDRQDICNKMDVEEVITHIIKYIKE